MCRIFLCLLFYFSYALFVNSESFLSEENAGGGDTEEIDASQCSEEYENCGVQYTVINVTDSTIINATTNEHYDDIIQQKTVKVHGFCCPGLVCKHEGYEEEPLAPGVTQFCADPENDLNRERMFEKWKKSLEMPPNYSY